MPRTFTEIKHPRCHFLGWDEGGPRRALMGLRARGVRGRMANNDWRPEHPICGNTDEQQYRNHDRWN
jgi:hypothetical protein